MKYLYLILTFCLINSSVSAQSEENNNYIAELWVSRNIALPNLLDTNYLIMAFTYLEPVNKFTPFKAINVGTLKFNDSTMIYVEKTRNYVSKEVRNKLSHIKWQLMNNNVTIEINNLIFPNITSYDFIPDTISKNKAIVVHINGLQNTTNIDWYIEDGQLHFSSPWNRNIVTNNNSCVITIPKPDLSLLNPTQSGKIRIVLHHKILEQKNNNNYLIDTRIVITKRIIIQ